MNDKGKYPIHCAAGHLKTLGEKWHIWNKAAIFLRKSGEYERALSLFQMNLNWSKVLHGSQVLVPSYINIASVLKKIGEFDKSIEYYQKALEFHNNEGNDFETSVILELMEIVYGLKQKKIGLSNDDESKLEVIKRKKKEIGRQFASASVTYNRRAMIYEELDMFDDALANYQVQLELLELTQNKSEINSNKLLKIYMRIAFCLYELKEYRYAFINFKKALVISEKLDEHENRTWIYYNMSKCELDKNKFCDRLYYLIKCQRSAIESNNHFAQCLSLEQRYKLFLNEGLIKEAFKCAQMHFEIADQINYEFEMKRAEKYINEIQEIESESDSYVLSKLTDLGLRKYIKSANKKVVCRNSEKKLFQLDVLQTISSEIGGEDFEKFERLALYKTGKTLFIKAEHLENSKKIIDQEKLWKMYESAANPLRQFLRMKPDQKEGINCILLLARIYGAFDKMDFVSEQLELLFKLAKRNENQELMCKACSIRSCFHIITSNSEKAFKLHKFANISAANLCRRDLQKKFAKNFDEIQCLPQNEKWNKFMKILSSYLS